MFPANPPAPVPNLTFCGYNSSLFSTVNAEVGAVWTAAHLAGALALPPVEDRRKEVARELDYMNARTHGKHARGTSVIPFSIRNIDEMLAGSRRPPHPAEATGAMRAPGSSERLPRSNRERASGHRRVNE